MKRLLLLILFAVSFFYLLFFHGLSYRDLWSSHEARAAMDAQTILEDGSWGLPRLFDGRPELQKPPLYYWLVASLGWWRGGVDELAVRLPAALSAVGTVLIVWRLGRPGAGLLAAGILATAVHFTWLARIGRIDMPLTMAITLVMASFYWARQAQRNNAQLVTIFRHLLTAYLALAVAVLLKGPIGFVLPAFAVAIHRMVEGELPLPWALARWVRLVNELGLWWGLPLVLGLTVPWFVWANIQTDGQFVEVFFWYHNFHRGLGGSALQTHPWWLYLVYFAGDFLPWTPFLIAALFLCWRCGYWPIDAEARLGLSWFLSMFALLSCACFKRADYLLPAYPGAALFLGSIAHRWLHEKPGLSKKVLGLLFPALMLGAVAFWFVRVAWTLPAQEPYRDYRRLAALVRREAPQPTPIVLFRTEAHALAFRLGRPLSILVEWSELQEYMSRPGNLYLVTTPASATELVKRYPDRTIEILARNDDRPHGHERPLVFLKLSRSQSPSKNIDTESSPHATDRHSASDRK